MRIDLHGDVTLGRPIITLWLDDISRDELLEPVLPATLPVESGVPCLGRSRRPSDVSRHHGLTGVGNRWRRDRRPRCWSGSASGGQR